MNRQATSLTVIMCTAVQKYDTINVTAVHPGQCNTILDNNILEDQGPTCPVHLLLMDSVINI